ncbi:MAG: adenylate kinase, partial [Flavobacteriales bacterium]
APLCIYYQIQEKFHSVNGIGTIQEITTRLTKLIESLN